MKTDFAPLDFINRKKEQKFLLDYLTNTPKNILFLYGPKSTGKTTLIKKVLKKLDQEKFHTSFYNMREYLITDFKSFQNVFFPANLKEKFFNLISPKNISVGTSGFSWSTNDWKMIDTHVFGTMVQKMEKLKEEGIQPVIVLDEFQYLRDIFIDDKKEVRLIEELFKFFIALTKQNNLAHVVCLTSDSYYMEELYNDTKLSNTSRFEMIDHLSQKDIEYWLGEKENCPKEMVQDILDNLGGSVWEIWQVFVGYKNTGDWKQDLDEMLQVKYSLLKDYYFQNWVFQDGDKEQEEQFIKVCKNIATTRKHEIQKGDRNLFVLVKDLVSKDFWFYNTKTTTITANSKSIEKGIGRLLSEL